MPGRPRSRGVPLRPDEVLTAVVATAALAGAAGWRWGSCSSCSRWCRARWAGRRPGRRRRHAAAGAARCRGAAGGRARGRPRARCGGGRALRGGHGGARRLRATAHPASPVPDPGFAPAPHSGAPLPDPARPGCRHRRARPRIAAAPARAAPSRTPPAARAGCRAVPSCGHSPTCGCSARHRVPVPTATSPPGGRAPWRLAVGDRGAAPRA